MTENNTFAWPSLDAFHARASVVGMVYAFAVRSDLGTAFHGHSKTSTKGGGGGGSSGTVKRRLG